LNHNFLLNIKTSGLWSKIGVSKRSGIAVPLFSIYSEKSTGIGEFRDLKKIIDWCVYNGFSIIQLLPVNDTGYDFAPYNAVSSFALDPVYITLDSLSRIRTGKFKKKIEDLKKKYPLSESRVNYSIKSEKISLLKEIFYSVSFSNEKQLEQFKNDNGSWLRDYVLFKIIKEKCGNKNWEEWSDEYKNRNPEYLKLLERENPLEFNFHCWIQLQAFEQFKKVKEYANKKGVLLMGDIPFLVSRDSADVWANQNHFKLNLSSGAPPDMYFAKGQRWGMPPYNWQEIEKDSHKYIINRLKFAENFYSMFRIDHFVGLLRLWTISLDEPVENAGMIGKFDPEPESEWENNARKILDVFIGCTDMMPCAEDLGTVPPSSYKILEEYGIPGIDVQRWKKHWGMDYEFSLAEEYRLNSISTISTHDSSFFPVWWKYEAGSIDKLLFERLCGNLNISGDKYKYIFDTLFDNKKNNNERLFWRTEIRSVEYLLNILEKRWEEAHGIVLLYIESFGEKERLLKLFKPDNFNQNVLTVKFIKANLEKVSETNSIFSIQQIFEYFYLNEEFLNKNTDWDYRINSPGLINQSNWTLRLPFPVEELKKLKINSTIKEINKKTERTTEK
jgi:4-alpha-glucanotransferase